MFLFLLLGLATQLGGKKNNKTTRPWASAKCQQNKKSSKHSCFSPYVCRGVVPMSTRDGFSTKPPPMTCDHVSPYSLSAFEACFLSFPGSLVPPTPRFARLYLQGFGGVCRAKATTFERGSKINTKSVVVAHRQQNWGRWGSVNCFSPKARKMTHVCSKTR